MGMGIGDWGLGIGDWANPQNHLLFISIILYYKFPLFLKIINLCTNKKL
jgi:hypothetical protein